MSLMPMISGQRGTKKSKAGMEVRFRYRKPEEKSVEDTGLEPVTSCMPCKRSSQLS